MKLLREWGFYYYYYMFSWWMQHNTMQCDAQLIFATLSHPNERRLHFIWSVYRLLFSCLKMSIAMENAIQCIALIWFGHLVLWNRRLQSTKNYHISWLSPTTWVDFDIAIVQQDSVFCHIRPFWQNQLNFMAQPFL